MLFPLCMSHRSTRPFSVVIFKGETLFPFLFTLHSLSPLPLILLHCASLFLLRSIATQLHHSLLSLHVIQASRFAPANDEQPDLNCEKGDSRRLDRICGHQEQPDQGQEGWIPLEDYGGDLPSDK
jgi:hypothetical protein